MVTTIGKQTKQEKDKRGIMALHAAKPDHWARFVVEQHESLIETETKGVEAAWLYRSELIQQFGRETAERWILAHKLEKGEDSDGESIYMRKRVVHNSNITIKKEYTNPSA